MENREMKERRERRSEAALEEHSRLSKLFKEDRLSFEREKKRMTDEITNSAGNDEQKKRLRAIQESWDRKMRKAGSEHNRFVLAQHLFWEHFNNIWNPAIQEFSRDLSRTFSLDS